MARRKMMRVFTAQDGDAWADLATSDNMDVSDMVSELTGVEHFGSLDKGTRIRVTVEVLPAPRGRGRR